VPSISGKTIGSDNNSRLTLSIWLDAGSNFNSRTDTLGQQSGTFDIAQVQIEAGSVATPFERRPIGTELALCQRYYRTLAGLITNGATASSANTRATWVYGAKMRATPTVTFTTVLGSSVTAFPSVDESCGFGATSDANNILELTSLTASAEL